MQQGERQGTEHLELGKKIIGHKDNVMQSSRAGALDRDVLSERMEHVY